MANAGFGTFMPWGTSPRDSVPSRSLTPAPTYPPPTYMPTTSPPLESFSSNIPLQEEGGALVVPVSINDAITLKFIIDSGAADVSIPADVFLTLMRAGTIDKSDFIGSRTYELADGSTVPSPTYRIRVLKIGTLEAENVTASIGDVKSELLLGQSFLKHFQSWSIDNSRRVLVLNQ
jgi:predicted aspartyl protease